MTSSKLTQRELEARLWDAANSLRGPVDAADFKAFVFPLLFYKWVSDTWDMEYAEAVADFARTWLPRTKRSITVSSSPVAAIGPTCAAPPATSE
jgi:type I restriction-modification system DNA methylase subunit